MGASMADFLRGKVRIKLVGKKSKDSHRYIVAKTFCDRKNGARSEQYFAANTFKPRFLEDTLKLKERGAVVQAAAKPRETLTLDKLLAELLKSYDIADLVVSTDVVPANWLLPRKCFDGVVYYTVEYRRFHFDVKAEQALVLNGKRLKKGEEIADFVILVPVTAVFRVNYKYNPKCCKKKPDRNPMEGRLGFDRDGFASELKKIAELKKRPFVSEGGKEPGG
jgi:hypothetical protein